MPKISFTPIGKKGLSTKKFEDHVLKKELPDGVSKADVAAILKTIRGSIGSPAVPDIFQNCALMFDFLATDIYANTPDLKRILYANQTPSTKIIFMPESKSIMDPYLLYFVNSVCKVEQGFTFGKTLEAGTDSAMIEK